MQKQKHLGGNEIDSWSEAALWQILSFGQEAILFIFKWLYIMFIQNSQSNIPSLETLENVQSFHFYSDTRFSDP